MKARVILVAADVDVEEEERGGGDERIKGGGMGVSYMASLNIMVGVWREGGRGSWVVLRGLVTRASKDSTSKKTIF
jgi:hypothetical protein